MDCIVVVSGEHTAHVGDVVGVEAANPNNPGQLRVVAEHAAHVRDVPRVEVVDVDSFHIGKIGEETAKVGNLP